MIKPRKEKLLISLIIFCVILLTAFFWVDFLRTIINNPYAVNPTEYQKGSLLGLHSIISFNTFVLLVWFILFYFYKKQFLISKKEKLFFNPLLLLSVLIITRFITLIPFFNEVPPNTYNLFFISLSLFMLFKTRFPKNIKKIVILGFLLLFILTVILDFGIRPERELKYTNEQEEIISILSNIEGRYVFVKNNKLNDMDSLIGIATMKFDLHTPLGLYTAQLPKSLQNKFIITNKALENKDCLAISKNFKDLNVKNIISYKNSCELLKNCNLNLKFEGNYSCLFTI